jgi:tetratricopeptide (TPR) repeat protein
MRRVNWPFAFGLILVFAATAGAFHGLHVVRYGKIAADLRWQVDRARDEGRSADAIKYAGLYLEFRPADVAMMGDLAGWLCEQPQSRKQKLAVLDLYGRMLRYNPEDAAIRQKAAELAMSLGDWAAAIDNFAVLLRTRPDDASLCEDNAYCLQVIGKYDESAAWYERSVRADPKRVSAYVGHAAILFQFLKQPDRALARVEEACRVNPQSGYAHAARAEYLRMRGRLNEAVEAVGIAQKYPSEDAREQQRIIEVAADVEQTAGHYDVSRKLLEDGYRKYPKNPRFPCNLAWQLHYEGRDDLAIAKLREAREANPQDPDILTLLGDLLAQDGQVGPLDDALRQLTEMNAPADRIQYVQGRLLIRRGRWAEAAALLDKLRIVAVQTPPLYRQANLLLAQCYEQLGDAAAEQGAYRRLLENDPNAGTVRLDYARALARSGQLDEAITQYLSVVPRAEVQSRAVAETTRYMVDRSRTDPATWGRLEKAVAALKVDKDNANPALARAYLDLTRFKADDSVPIIDGMLRTNRKSVALHVARVVLAEQTFGIDRALAAVSEAEGVVGDQPELRIVRARLLAARIDAATAESLSLQARGVERFNADDRSTILREVIAGYRVLGDAAAVDRHLDQLARLRPDSLAARESIFARALKSGDESRCRSTLREVESIEGPDGPTARLLDVEQILWTAQSGDAAALSKAGDLLTAAARGRPRDPLVEFLRGRVDELAGRGGEALAHYGTAFAGGLADRPVEDLFANLLGKSGSAPVEVLRDQLPLTSQLRPDCHRALIATVAGLWQRKDGPALTTFAERLTSAAPADPVAQVWLGRLFAGLKLDVPAEDCFRRAAAAAPQSPDGWLGLIAFQAGRGNNSGLETAAAQVRSKLAPIEAHLVVGRALESIGRLDAAQIEYENAVALLPDDTRPLKLLVNLASARNQPEEARKRLEQLATIAAPSQPDDRSWARRTLAVQIAKAEPGRGLERALALLDQSAVEGKPSEDDLRARATILAAHRNEPAPKSKLTCRREAIRILEDLRQREKTRPDDLVVLARLYRADGDEAAARQARERMAAEYPTNFGCIAFLAREAMLRDHDKDCERWLPALQRFGAGQFETFAVEFQYRALGGAADRGRQLLEEYIAAATSPDDHTSRTLRCANMIDDFLQVHPPERSQAGADLRATAIRLYRPLAERNVDAFQRLVTLFASMPGGTNQAVELVQRTKRAFGPAVAAAAYVEIVRRGKPDEVQKRGIGQFIRAEMEKDPRSTPLLLTRAEYLQSIGDTAGAVAAYRETLRREPDNVVALNNLAWTLSQDRRDESKVAESLACIEQAINVAGPLDELLDTRARILFESGRRDEGLRDMREAVTESPTAARLADYAAMLQKAGKAEEAERALAAAQRFGLRAN